MKPVYGRYSRQGQQSRPGLCAKRAPVRVFWHYHAEYELTLIGKRGAGGWWATGMNILTAGPRVGWSGLPHTWVSDGNRPGQVAAVVVQFSAEFMERFTNWKNWLLSAGCWYRPAGGFHSAARVPWGGGAAEQLPEKKRVGKNHGLPADPAGAYPAETAAPLLLLITSL